MIDDCRVTAKAAFVDANQLDVALLASVLGHIQEGVIRFDRDGQAETANPMALQILGLPREKVIGSSAQFLLGRRDDPVLHAITATCAVDFSTTQEAGEHTKRLVGTAIPLVSEGLSIGACLIVRDVSQNEDAAQESKVLHEALEEQRLRLNAIIANVPGVVWEAWAEPALADQKLMLRMEYVSDYVEAMLGFGVSEWLATPNFLFDVVHSDDRDEAFRTTAEIFERRAFGRNQFRCLSRDQREVWVDSYAVVISDEYGQPVGMRGVMLDVTDRRNYEFELKKAKEAAEQANRAKDHFLAVLSHELRTPLTPVLAAVQRLREEANLPEETRGLLEVIERNVEIEARLIDDLLDLTNMVKGVVRLTFTHCDVHEVLRGALQASETLVQEKGITVTLDLSAKKTWVRGDNGRLQQVFYTLVQNALKFTPHSGRIALHTSIIENEQLKIEVSDEGVGIEPHVLARIFKAFEQGEQSLTRRFGGLGLGLAMSQHLVERHDGVIVASSAGTGKGSTFAVLLPLIAPPLPTTQATNRRRILLVDDHDDTQVLMRMMLERRGFEVGTAANVHDALALARAEHFDLLVSDIGLPDGTGLELMRRLRDLRPLPGIALSGFGMESDVQRSQDAGFSEHLTKPVNFQRLEEAIQKLLAEAV